MRSFSVLLIADDPLINSNLESILQSDSRFTLFGTTSIANYIEGSEEHQHTDSALIDLGWNNSSARNILSSLPHNPAMLVLLPDGFSQSDTLLMPFAGAIPRRSSPDAILTALAGAALGLTIRERTTSGSLIPSDEAPTLAAPIEPLTPRENEVLAYLLEGLPNKIIARQLGISEHTAKFHVTSILAKLGAQSRTEAVIRAARLGLIRM